MNYERINWENGTQVEGAYVEINGTRYPVVMPTYDCDTPVTAENLNIMDEGIDAAINKEEINLIIPSGVIQQEPLKMYKIGNIINISGIARGSSSNPTILATFDKKYLPKSGVYKYVGFQDNTEEPVPVIVSETMYGDDGAIQLYDGQHNVQINITYFI